MGTDAASYSPASGKAATSDAGDYTVRVTYVTDAGCSTSAVATTGVTVLDQPKINPIKIDHKTDPLRRHGKRLHRGHRYLYQRGRQHHLYLDEAHE